MDAAVTKLAKLIDNDSFQLSQMLGDRAESRFVKIAEHLDDGVVQQIEKRIASALNGSSFVGYLWWIAQWPILIAGLLAAFATILYLSPNLRDEHRRWRFITPGAVIAAVVWLAVSGLFAVYTAKFGSYNKTWGSLSAVIVMLTWLWLSSLALLFGAELNAEIEGRHQRRRGCSAA